MIEGVASSLVASLIFFLLGYSYSRLVAWFRLRGLRNLWKPLLGHRAITVVLSTRQGPHAGSTRRVSLNEVRAFSGIAETAKSLGCHVSILDSDSRSEEWIGRDVVLLGGPLANNATRMVWEKIAARLPFELDLQKFAITIAQRTYTPEEDQEGHLLRDFALLIRVRDILTVGNAAFLCIGCHGFGTSGAAGILYSGNAANKVLRSLPENEDFCVLLEVPVQQGTITAPVVREQFVLPR